MSSSPRTPAPTRTTTAVRPARAAAWKPDVKAARAYAAKRPGTVSFALLDGKRSWRYRSYRSVAAASLMKPMLLAAYLRRGDVRKRPLRRGERALLAPMIRWSDNASATRVRNIVGVSGLLRVAHAVRMRDFIPFGASWGYSRTSARDQALLFSRLHALLPRRHRVYAFGLLRTIVREQRWGIAQAAPRGWRVYFKGGWGSGSGAVDHQAALLVRGERRVALAITTAGNPNHAAGKATLRGVAARLLRGLV